MRLTVVGCGDAFGSGGRFNTCFWVETAKGTLAVDFGASTPVALNVRGLDHGRIDGIILSHLHGDHFGGVPFLFMDFLYDSERTRPIEVYGPPGTRARVSALFAALYPRQASETLPFDVSFVELPTPGTTVVRGVAMEAFPVRHVAELVCYGFRITVGGRTIVYSGDTGWTDAFIARTTGADLFICECSTFETRLDIHVSYPEVAARAASLGCRRLLLSHLGAEPLRRRGEITLEIAEDGMVIPL